MKAWQCDDTRPIPGLVRADMPQPTPAAGEVLVRVQAAGVTPSELEWFPTTHLKSGENRLRAIPGHEFSGVVAAGDGTKWTVGQEVFGMNDWFADGATAEFCCAPASGLTMKPAALSPVQAAGIPIAALTAWQGLFDRGQLLKGQRVLIHGGSGAVGVLAIQLARWHGAEVLTTASERNRQALLDLGATRVIDYRGERFEEVVAPGVDVVFDGVGGETLARSWSLLKPGGRMVTIASSGEGHVDERTKQAFFIVEPKGEQLAEIARLFDSGALRPVIDAVASFDEAGDAYARQGKFKGGFGKTVVQVN